MSKESLKFQWAQLLSLTFLHCMIDMFGGMLPTILPVIQKQFGLTIVSGLTILAALNLTANGILLPTGHLRPDKTKPLFLPLSLLLITAICLMAALPGQNAFVFILVLASVTGVGIGLGHPEGMRSIHALDKIPPSISTAVFFTGGFTGYAGGGYVSVSLVSAFGLKGLYALFACPFIGLIIIYLFRIKLAVESKPSDAENKNSGNGQIAFWPVFIMTLPMTTSTVILTSLVPTRLHELDFVLTFGGFSAMMLGIGGAIGSLTWAVVAHKKGELNCACLTLFLAVPLLTFYLVMIKTQAAVWMLFGTGFFAVSAFPLMVTLARHAKGPNLGMRMAFIIGGTWGFASIVLILMGPVAKRFGTAPILAFTPAGYLLAAAIGIALMRRKRKLTQSADSY